MVLYLGNRNPKKDGGGLNPGGIHVHICTHTQRHIKTKIKITAKRKNRQNQRPQIGAATLRLSRLAILTELAIKIYIKCYLRFNCELISCDYSEGHTTDGV